MEDDDDDESISNDGGDTSGREDESESESESPEMERQRMLALLDEQCSALTGFALPATLSNAKDEDDDDNDDSEASQEDTEDEWNGIVEDGSAAAARTPMVIFDASSGASSSRQTLEDLALADGRDSFMSSKVRHHVSVEASTSRKGKGRAAQTSEEAAEEEHLASLDASLLSLIKGLPSDPSSRSTSGNRSSQISSLIPTLSTSLPNPRYTVRKDVEASIDPKAPRLLREALYSTRLNRAKTRAEMEKESGIVSAGSGEYALTKKKRREQTGAEDHRRKNAKGLGGVVGKMRQGGGVLTLSRDEIKKGGEGDFDSLMGRRRKGAPKGLGGAGKGKGKSKTYRK